ncbi:hypothetical protein Bca4012_071999 [Brassica carinata]|uniref:(rape) hypothetical protein n=1 Tax=Brassica napus TaxID=3708 RepID=A0A816KZL7_BRANA|nr:unnamed protein product [Brassica napus]
MSPFHQFVICLDLLWSDLFRSCFWFILVSPPSRYSPEAHGRPVRVLCTGVRIRRLIQAGSVWVWLVMWRPCFRFRHPSVRKDAIVSSTSQAVLFFFAGSEDCSLMLFPSQPVFLGSWFDGGSSECLLLRAAFQALCGVSYIPGFGGICKASW